VAPVVPKKALGQHFLVDPNLLGVIGRLAVLDRSDVVLEIGPGLGVLTRYLAARVSLVHAVEVDRSLEPVLADALDGAANVRLHWGDALRLDLQALEPPRGKLVATLPYNIATPVIVETLVGLSAVGRWCVMVQREVADRLFAEPSTKAYGAVSVVVRLTARRTGLHSVSRHVFRPPPRVESALVAFERITPPPRLTEVRTLVDAGFGHRRKTLANALVLAGLGGRESVVDALDAIGRPPTVRAEELEPGAWVALEEVLRR